MTTPSCQTPLDWDTLLAYWLGELDPDSEARTEEHYLGCAECSRRLEWLTTLAQEVRALTQKSGVSVVLNNQFVRKLTEHGLHVREYRVPCNGSVNCTVTPDDDFVMAYLEAPLAGVTRLDMVYLDDEGKPQLRQEDIPFSAENGDVVFSTRIDALRALPTTTLHVRLLAVDKNGERTLGDYTFNHTAYTSPGSE
jgi:hypothetical protein